jgi:hypothetical protein
MTKSSHKNRLVSDDDDIPQTQPSDPEGEVESDDDINISEHETQGKEAPLARQESQEV